MHVRGDRFLEELCTRRLDHATFPRVYLDASYVKSRRKGIVAFEAIVAATGVREDGGLEILGLDVGDSEDARFWRRFLISLCVRGLRGVQLLGSDEHGGLQDALTDVLPHADWTYSPTTASAGHGRSERATARHRGWWAVPGNGALQVPDARRPAPEPGPATVRGHRVH